MATTLPRGIGTEAEIDQANRWMREQPWYQDLLRSWGQTGDVHLNDWQKKQLLNEARVRGLGISDRMEIDPAGNINPKGHKLRNTAIIAGAAAGGYFAAPYIAGALAGGGSSAAPLAATPTVGSIGSLAPELVGGYGMGAVGGAGLAGAAAPGAAAALLPATSTVSPVGSLAPELTGGYGMPAASLAPQVTPPPPKTPPPPASKVPGALRDLAPLAAYAIPKLFGPDSGPSGPNLTPEQQAMLNDLLNLQYQRAARQAPIHQAAMAMATRMAPRYARDAMGPTPTPSMPSMGAPSGVDPDVARAIEALSRNRV